jgi:hypothetical protein
VNLVADGYDSKTVNRRNTWIRDMCLARTSSIRR